MRTLAVAALLLATSTPAIADIYLLSRQKLEGTDFTAAFFLSHPQMTSLATCEQERTAARTTGFKLFARLYFGTRKGLNTQDQLYCVESDQKFTPFRPNPMIDFTYLVSLSNSRMTVEPMQSLGACSAIAGRDTGLSGNRFCAKGSQSIQRAQTP